MTKLRTTVRALSESALAQSEAEFLKAYPHPVVLIVIAPAKKKSEDAEKTNAFTTLTADKLPKLQAPQTLAESYKDAAIHPLVKSGRNAFGDMITVGRTPNNDLPIPTGTISKFHGYFREVPGGGMRYHDSGSATNGNWHMGERLESRGSVELRDGSELGFGPEVRALYLTAKGLFTMIKRDKPPVKT